MSEWEPTGGGEETDSDAGSPSRREPIGGGGGRVVVVLVLLAMLVGGLALERRDPDVVAATVAPIGVDGPAVPPADAISTAWYCAAGSSDPGGTSDETVFVANLSTRPLSATVTVDPGGRDDPASRRIGVPALGRGEVRVGGVLASPSPGVVVEVMGGPAIVEHEIQGKGDVAMSPCAPQPSPVWYFAAGGTQRGSTQSLELFNPFGDDAIVDVTFFTDGGVQEPQALQGLVVSRRSKIRVPVQDLVERQERVATLVRSRTGRVVAEQVRTFDGTDGHGGMTLTLGANDLRKLWAVPMSAGSTGMAATVAIANPGLAPVSVEVSVVLSDDGVLAPQTIDVPSRSVEHVDVGAGVPRGAAYAVVVRSLGGTPVVVESLVSGRTASATATGSATAARQWAFAGAPSGTSAAVVAVNRGTTPITVELRAYTEGDVNSPRSAPAIAVAPGKVARFDLDEWGIGADQVLVVSADQPIVAGREIYAGGLSLSLGVPFPR